MLVATTEGGNVAGGLPSVTVIETDGELRSVSSAWADPGALAPDAILPTRVGAFASITPAEVHDLLATHSSTGEGGIRVSLAYAGTVNRDQLAELCATLVEDFVGIGNWTGDGSIADMPRSTFTTHTAEGVHSASYKPSGGDPPDAFERLVDRFRNAREPIAEAAEANASQGAQESVTEQVGLNLTQLGGNASPRESANCLHVSREAGTQAPATQARARWTTSQQEVEPLQLALLGPDREVLNRTNGTSPLGLTEWGEGFAGLETWTYGVKLPEDATASVVNRSVTLDVQFPLHGETHPIPDPSFETGTCGW